MFKKIIPLNTELHAGKKFTTQLQYEFARAQHLCAVAIHEFPKACAHYPILFTRQPGREHFMPVALLGIQPGHNLFVQADGSWLQGGYVPAAFRRYPFVLIKTDDDSLSICMDDRPELLDPDKGIELIAADGSETPFLQKTRAFLVELLKSEMLTEKFCQKLEALDLLVPGSLEIRIQGQVQHIPGAFVVDEKRLNALSAEDFAGLREHGFLGAIYAHLLSLSQIDAVVALAAPK